MDALLQRAFVCRPDDDALLPLLRETASETTETAEAVGCAGCVGFDLEWTSGSDHLAAMQICTAAQCAVVRLVGVAALPPRLAAFLSDSRVLKYGVALAGAVELQRLAARHGYTAGGLSLQAITRAVLALPLDKAQRLSDWDRETLSPEQVAYAAADACAARLCLAALVERHALPGQTLSAFCAGCINAGPLASSGAPRHPRQASPSVSAEESCASSKKREGFGKLYRLLDSEGQELCTCNERRAGWYASRGLGAVDELSRTVRLSFSPAERYPQHELFFLWTRETRCVACGSERALNKFSVVPPKYRKHFPAELKGDHLPNAVLLCADCHAMAIAVMQQHDRVLERETGIPLGCPQRARAGERARVAQKTARALLGHGATMPQRARDECVATLRELTGEETVDDAVVERVANGAIDEEAPEKALVATLHTYDDFAAFVQRWKRQFEVGMSPRFLPSYWDVCAALPPDPHGAAPSAP
eukprot:m51a1_g8609 hypothetical protein (477) ;mRNA; r:204365-206764